jgi:prostaglandin-H2 D-isomerase / glutathione transferase
MSYKLYYFSIRGRGEQVRLFLHALALPFEDVIVNREEFLRLKKQGAGTLTFGSLPMLEDGDFRLCQGPVILSYLAHRHDVAPVLATANRSLWALMRRSRCNF